MEFIILFIYLNLINSLTLEKYSTISVEWEINSILFDSKDFFIGDEMDFKFRTKGSCGNNISYAYYDGFGRAYQFYEALFQAFSNKEEIKDEYEIKYFRIKKNSEELNGLFGNYLLIRYNCTDTVEITNININPKLSLGYIILIVFACIILSFSIVIIIVIKQNRKNKEYIKTKSQNNNNQNINSETTFNKESENQKSQNSNNHEKTVQSNECMINNEILILNNNNQ